MQNFDYLYDTNNETAGVFVPAQILYDAFHGRYHNSTGAIIVLFVIWGSFFFGGLSITTSAARVVRNEKHIPLNALMYSYSITRYFNKLYQITGIRIIKGPRDTFLIDMATYSS